jgi:hypothetical protein
MATTRSYNISNGITPEAELGLINTKYGGGARLIIDRLRLEYNTEQVYKY